MAVNGGCPYFVSQGIKGSNGVVGGSHPASASVAMALLAHGGDRGGFRRVDEFGDIGFYPTRSSTNHYVLFGGLDRVENVLLFVVGGNLALAFLSETIPRLSIVGLPAPGLGSMARATGRALGDCGFDYASEMVPIGFTPRLSPDYTRLSWGSRESAD